MSFTANDIKKLREITGAGVMDCKHALTQAKGDFAQAKAIVIERGLARAEKKSDRETKEGVVTSYAHSTGRVASLVELQCETDFVARNDEFKSLAHDIAMQVAAMSPKDTVELLQQDFIKNPSISVETAIKQLSGKVGEKLLLSRFERLELGK